MQWFVFETPRGEQWVYGDSMPWLRLDLGLLRRAHPNLRLIGIWREKRNKPWPRPERQ